MGSLDDPFMFAQDLSFGRDDNAFGVDPHTDRPVGEGGGHAVPVALERYQARRGHPLARSTKPSKGRPSGIRLVTSAACTSAMVPGRTPCWIWHHPRDALRFEPGIERIDIREGRHHLP